MPCALDRVDLERLVKLLGMLGSAHDGERAAAGLKAHELIRRHGLQWSDVILAAPAPAAKREPVVEPWRRMAWACCKHLHRLTAWERNFVQDMTLWRGAPSEKQINRLHRIYAS